MAIRSTKKWLSKALSVVASLLLLFWSFETLISTLQVEPAMHPSQPEKETQSQPNQTSPLPPALPEIYSASHRDSEACENKYGLQYLYSLAATKKQYCEPQTSASKLSCFNAPVSEDHLRYSCIASQMHLPPDSKRFQLDCDIRNYLVDKREQTPFRELEWYSTGPGYLFQQYIDSGPDTAEVKECTPASSNTSTPATHSILIKREGAFNLWHCLMEIFSYTLTMDLLHISTDEDTGAPHVQSADVDTTQIILLDNLEPGPYDELWHLLARRPIVRMSELQERGVSCLPNVIIPLAGATNPMWKGDWTALDCTQSRTLSVFADRILNFLSVPQQEEPADELVLTFIARSSSRRLINQDTLFEKLREIYPHITINVVDFAGMLFRDQVSIIRNTNILVGVHGAGLTHSLFLPPDSSVVEILPNELNHKGFRNLAKLRGHEYFRAHGLRVDPALKGDWHSEDVEVDEGVFLELVEAAVRSRYHKGMVDLDIGG